MEQAIPSVVFDAKDDSGALFDVTVSIDGNVVATSLDGRPLEVDPGVHEFEFTRPGNPPIKKKEIIREGEKSRGVTASWMTTKTESSTSDLPATPMHRPVPTGVYVLGGLGLAGLGAFAYFGLSGNGKKSDLDACAPFCPRSRADDVHNQYLFANISLGVGAAALAGSLIYYLVRPSRPIDAEKAPPTEGAFRFMTSPHGGAVSWEKAF